MKVKTNFKLFLEFTDKLHLEYYKNNKKDFRKFEKYKNEKYIKVSDIIQELNYILDSIPKSCCDIDSTLIVDLIRELKNAKSN